MYKQLELFPEIGEHKFMEELQLIRESYEKIHKSQFAKIGEIKKMCHDMNSRLELLEAHICKNDLFTK